jgi:release factor glutamine methyltransferase
MMKVRNEATKTIGAALGDLIVRLKKNSETASLDAQVLVSHVLRQSSAWVLAHPENTIPDSKVDKLERLAFRLEGGEPLPYVLGRWEFFGLDFLVTPDVLIPRPETELLVERALAWLDRHPGQRRAADIGTGSGCIGIALAANMPDLQVMASDLSAEALKLAQKNAINNGVAGRMVYMCCDLFPPELQFDLIVANLPYIPTQTLSRLPIYGREPTMALDGGEDGLKLIRRLLNAAPERLAPGGYLLMELEESEGLSALSLANNAFTEAEIHLHKDLAGHNRILEIQV